MLSLSLVLQEQHATKHFQINITFLCDIIILYRRVFFLICSAFFVLPLKYNLLQEIPLILQPKGVPKPVRFWSSCLQWFISRTLYCIRYSTLTSCSFFCQSRSFYKSDSFMLLSDIVLIYVSIYICIEICIDVFICTKIKVWLLRETLYSKFQCLFRYNHVPSSFFPSNNAY